MHPSLKRAAQWSLLQSIKREQSNPTQPGHNFNLAVLFSNHMGSWPEEYHEIRYDSRFHCLPTNYHRGSEAAALLSLELVRTVRSRQGYRSLWPLRVGVGCLLTLSGVVLDSAAGKDKGQSRKMMLTQVLKDRERERITDHTTSKEQKDLALPILWAWDFQNHHTKHPPQPSLPCVFSYQDEVWGNEKESFLCQF